MNIEKLLEDHLWNEVCLIRKEITKLEEKISGLREREERLIRIGNAALIPFRDGTDNPIMDEASFV
jgi:hypothetical protein